MMMCAESFQLIPKFPTFVGSLPPHRPTKSWQRCLSNPRKILTFTVFGGEGVCDFATKAEFGPGCSYIVACGRLWKGERKMPVCLLFTTRATYILSWSSQELSFGAKEDVVAHQDYDQHVSLSFIHMSAIIGTHLTIDDCMIVDVHLQ